MVRGGLEADGGKAVPGSADNGEAAALHVEIGIDETYQCRLGCVLRQPDHDIEILEDQAAAAQLDESGDRPLQVPD